MRPLLLSTGMLVAALALPVSPLPGQGKAEKPAKALPADLALVPGDAPLVVTLRPGDLLGDPFAAALLSLMKVEELNSRELLVPLGDIERVTFLPQGRGPLRIVRTSKPYDRKKVMAALPPPRRPIDRKGVEKDGPPGAPKDKPDAGNDKGQPKVVEKTIGGKTVVYHETALSHDEGIALVDKHIFLVGPLASLTRALGSKAARSVELESALRQADRHTALTFVQGRPWRANLRKLGFVDEIGPRAGDPLSDLPSELLPYKPLFEGKHLLLTGDLKPQLRFDLAFTAEKGADLDDAETALKTTLYVLRQMPAFSDGEAELGPVATLFKPFREALRAAKVTRQGDALRTSVQVAIPAAARKKLTAAIAQFLKQGVPTKNLEAIGLAFHNYHSAYDSFPTAAITKNGKPLLSWRVALLPYLGDEEAALYKQFKLDEPWDSKHNKTLLEKLPKFYSPGPGLKAKEGHTFFQVFTGPNTLFPTPNHKTRLTTITDGSSNTLLVVEAAEAVPWTKPADLVIDARKPLPKLGAQFDGVFLALRADGLVLRLPRKLDAKLLRWLIDPADGNEIDWKAIQGKK